MDLTSELLVMKYERKVKPIYQTKTNENYFLVLFLIVVNEKKNHPSLSSLFYRCLRSWLFAVIACSCKCAGHNDEK